MKKYFIRAIGTLCILGAVALMFLSAWVELDGVKKSNLRDVREDIDGVLDTVSSFFLNNLDNDDFQDELEDNDLPYKRTDVKKQFKELDQLSKDLLDNSISMKELMTLAVKTPGVVTDLENILELQFAEAIFYRAARYVLVQGNNPMINAGEQDIMLAADVMQEKAENAVVEADGLKSICYGLVAVLVLVLLLAIAGAATHVCDKVRWLKYIFFAVLLLLVVGSLVAMPAINEILSDATAATPAMEDLELKMTLAPILAVALMFVPIVLDIIFERKKQNY